jgi:HEAT repeat protein
LKAALNDEASEVRGAARWALAQIEDEDAVRPRVKVRPRAKNRI